jgi:hypothetical protein
VVCFGFGLVQRDSDVRVVRETLLCVLISPFGCFSYCPDHLPYATACK